MRAVGGIGDADVFNKVEKMYKMNVVPTLVSAHLASNYFTPSKGLCVLTGAQSALVPLSWAFGYGLSKEAVHYIIRTLALDEKGRTVGILPKMIDTPANR